MQAFVLSLRSEFYKSRNTLAFWSAIILPIAIVGLVFFGFYTNSDKMQNMAPMFQWFRYFGAILGVMGILLLPMFVIFISYSVNNMEHRSEMWKSLFSLPLGKWSIYSSKYFFTVILNALCISMFFGLIIGSGQLLSLLKPVFRFDEFQIAKFAFDFHLKMFLATLGILSIQFLLSLVWADFLKPMGIGFIGTICGIIAGNTGWKYAYMIPYAHPFLTVNGYQPKGQTPQINFLTNEIYVSIGVAIV